MSITGGNRSPARIGWGAVIHGDRGAVRVGSCLRVGTGKGGNGAGNGIGSRCQSRMTFGGKSNPERG